MTTNKLVELLYQYAEDMGIQDTSKCREDDIEEMVEIVDILVNGYQSTMIALLIDLAMNVDKEAINFNN